ncbi:MAG: hypothetical protein A2Y40_04465 [Candidatus Margulisbacteria bacterium GWF2_35_9]|nr:MAG: hypothetical protein A2Y40_04465 [Candidatus Margulisbacteria bacterium GWF2_35_9]
MKLIIKLFFCSTFINLLLAYPYDGFLETGIRRLHRIQAVIETKRGTLPIPPGGKKKTAEIHLNLMNQPSIDVKTIEKNSQLQRLLIKNPLIQTGNYGVAILDISNPEKLRYAAINETKLFDPGSVGKLAIAAGFFNELASIYPNSSKDRQTLLRTHMVTAGKWVVGDVHAVPHYNINSGSYSYAIIKPGETFNLYEWLDHMLAFSANAAGSTVWKEAMLMRVFKTDYPVSKEVEEAFFRNTSPAKLAEIALSVVNDPLRALGISEPEWQLGSFFTQYGKKQIPGIKSYASPESLLCYLIKLEQGKIVDDWSSLEIKKLLYMTRSRFRYSDAKSLDTAAVYFKSGSLYMFQPESGFVHKNYEGNKKNFMNSVVIIEHDDNTKYLVALMSNVLKRNSSKDHLELADFIDHLIRNNH